MTSSGYASLMLLYPCQHVRFFTIIRRHNILNHLSGTKHKTNKDNRRQDGDLRSRRRKMAVSTWRENLNMSFGQMYRRYHYDVIEGSVGSIVLPSINDHIGLVYGFMVLQIIHVPHLMDAHTVHFKRGRVQDLYMFFI